MTMFTLFGSAKFLCGCFGAGLREKEHRIACALRDHRDREVLRRPPPPEVVVALALPLVFVAPESLPAATAAGHDDGGQAEQN